MASLPGRVPRFYYTGAIAAFRRLVRPQRISCRLGRPLRLFKPTSCRLCRPISCRLFWPILCRLVRPMRLCRGANAIASLCGLEHFHLCWAFSRSFHLRSYLIRRLRRGMLYSCRSVRLRRLGICLRCRLTRLCRLGICLRCRMMRLRRLGICPRYHRLHHHCSAWFGRHCCSLRPRIWGRR